MFGLFFILQSRSFLSLFCPLSINSPLRQDHINITICAYKYTLCGRKKGDGKDRGKHLEILEIEGESIEKKYVLTHKGFVNNNH